MQDNALLGPLNAAQRTAVASAAPHTLVLAGAGSGKTRVLVHRIAWLIENGLASPNGILAVTFTNKAAAEMRARLEQLLGRPVHGMWVGTFHGIAHRLLRAHAREANLPEQFQIMDSDDQQKLLRRVIRGLGLDDTAWQPKELQWFINGRKDEGERPAHIDAAGDVTLETMVRIYSAYEETCARGGLVDFAELLLRAFETLRDTPGLLRHYRERFRHVLVDEFQDTNAIQYAWLRLVAGEEGCVFAVGDDDQSIYSWRGARVENMLAFQRHFPQHEVVRLEQNYRSTGCILDAANALIANNHARLGKQLWTSGGRGEPIRLYAAFNDLEEARWCTERLRDWHARGGRYDEAAILYRTSAQSRVMEDALRQQDIPYRVHGGFRFYERAEIRDALAYLRLANHRGDDAAFERVVNTPARGIGAKTLEDLRHTARLERISLWEAAQRLIANRELSARAGNALGGFLKLVTQLAEEIENKELGAVIDTVVARSGLVEHYLKEKGDRGEDRVDNLRELAIAAQDFKPTEMDTELPLLSLFLSHAALEAGEGQAAAHEDSVQLMTLHSAKGLEFENVFLVGLEEGLFPHLRSANDPVQLEEERRLCYVGITRAMKQLSVSYAESRRQYGKEEYPKPSRFLREIPAELVQEVRVGSQASALRAGSVAEPDGGYGLRLGQRVMHRTFGEGVVLQLEGRGAHTRVQVNFADSGMKWLVAAYAGLEAC